MNRRAFIKICGCAGCGVLLTLTGCNRPTGAAESAGPTATTQAPVSLQSATPSLGTNDPAATIAATVTPPAETTATPLPRTGKILCPRGIYWDRYPGKCNKYRDTNANGYCDWSEPA